jgi:hypothetical protein
MVFFRFGELINQLPDSLADAIPADQYRVAASRE